MQSTVSFNVEAQLAAKLLGLLESEQAVLVSQEIEAIEKLLEEKAQLLNELSTHTQQRYQTLAVKGFEASESGMRQWLAQQNESGVFKAWNGFQETLTRSKEVNRVNGMLITKHFSRNQQTLNALQTSQGGGFYGPNGQAASGSLLRNGLKA